MGTAVLRAAPITEENMIGISNETKEKLIAALDSFRKVAGSNRVAAIDALIAALENADPVPIWFVMRTGNTPENLLNREEIMGAFASCDLAEAACVQPGDAVVGPLYIDEQLSDVPESWHGYYPKWPLGDGLKFEYREYLKEKHAALVAGLENANSAEAIA